VEGLRIEEFTGYKMGWIMFDSLEWGAARSESSITRGASSKGAPSKAGTARPWTKPMEAAELQIRVYEFTTNTQTLEGVCGLLEKDWSAIATYKVLGESHRQDGGS
jgi:hypothetical protein